MLATRVLKPSDAALYDAAVRSTDEAIGRILDTVRSLGLMDETVVGIAGDHGEEIGEHGDYGHECMNYEHNARIPLIFKPVAGHGAPGHVDTLTSSLDFTPTLAALAGREGLWAEDSIEFGDLDNPYSKVARLAHSVRAFELLEDLGTKPKVYYLTEGEKHGRFRI